MKLLLKKDLAQVRALAIEGIEEAFAALLEEVYPSAKSKIYALKERAATDLVRFGTSSVLTQSEAQRTGLSEAAAAALILERHAETAARIARIEAARLSTKREIEAATSAPAITRLIEAAHSFIQQQRGENV
ncbi:hypothetical protein [Rhizobium paknamense]|uniref:Uncharacterized protein n=1 Tax=Rhizobium paknamense TaxID=1206817 RepID=A0ABU0I8U8_9HYPH|nr:hypothetical protein [Rhizobium paknamense]MDQ0454667.1 hypothetical protein [Rhizobium paknamense]